MATAISAAREKDPQAAGDREKRTGTRARGQSSPMSANAAFLVAVTFLIVLIGTTLLLFVLGYWQKAHENAGVNEMLTSRYQVALSEIGFVSARLSIFGGPDIEYELKKNGLRERGSIEGSGDQDFYAIELDGQGLHFVINGAAFDSHRGFLKQDAYSVAAEVLEKILILTAPPT